MLIADVHQQIEDKVPGLQVEIAQLMEDLIGDLTAVPQPIEIKMFSDDAVTLRTDARKWLTSSRMSEGTPRSTMASFRPAK